MAKRKKAQPKKAPKKGRSDTLKSKFVDLLGDDRDVTTTELIARLDAHEFWTPEYLNRLLKKGKAAFIHQMMRSIHEDDWREFGCIEGKDENGDRAWRYVHRSKMTLKDYDQVCTYYRNRANEYRDKYDHWAALRQQRFPDAPSLKRKKW